jgi:uncharacterized protein YjbJ (UPF0337 family)
LNDFPGVSKAEAVPLRKLKWGRENGVFGSFPISNAMQTANELAGMMQFAKVTQISSKNIFTRMRVFGLSMRNSFRGLSRHGICKGRFRRENARTNKDRKRMNMLAIRGDWKIAKGRVKQRLARLSDDHLQFMEGMEEELIGRIQKRTAQTRNRFKPACVPVEKQADNHLAS